jgi:hypothetical protein
MTIVEFLEARIAEDEEREARKFRDSPGALAGYTVTSTSEGEFGVALNGSTERPRFMSIAEYVERFCEPAPDVRMLAECAAKRAIIKQHEDWPVLVERAPSGDFDANDTQSMVYRMTREIAWLTEREYVRRFGVEPPTTPMLRALATVYKDHPDYDENWAL